MPLAPDRRRIALAIAAVTFMLVLDSTILNTSLPAIAASQGVPPLSLSAVVTAFLLAGAALLPIAAWLGDRFGLRRVFLAGVGTFTAASLACAAAGSPTALVLARMLQGAGGAMILPLGRTIALRGARREDVVGITALLTWPALFGPVLGPPLGGLLSTYASWRWNFLINVPIGLAAMALLARWVPADPPAPERPMDITGFIGAALGLTLFVGGVEALSHRFAAGEGRSAAGLCVLAGVTCLVLTLLHFRRTVHPLVSLSPFEHTTFRFSIVGGLLGSIAIQSTPFLLPLLFQLGLGRDAVTAGALLLPYFLANLGMKAVTTPILHRFGFRTVLVVAGICSTLGIGAFAAVDAATPSAALLALLVFTGSARSMTLTAVNTLAVADMPSAKLGASSTFAAISMQVASATGVAVATLSLALASHLAGRLQPAVAEFHVAFLVLAVFNACAVASFARMPAAAGAEVLRPRANR